NVREVLLRTSEVIEKVRADSQPRFIEALCYRFKGHSVVDPDKYRSAEDKEKFRKADPIVAFEHELETSGLADEEYFKAVRQEIDAQVQDIIKFADDSPDPKVEDLYKYVYAAEWEQRAELRGNPLQWPRKNSIASLCVRPSPKRWSAMTPSIWWVRTSASSAARTGSPKACWTGSVRRESWTRPLPKRRSSAAPSARPCWACVPWWS